MEETIFDTGLFRVMVPEGWSCFYGTDSSGETTPKKVHVYKAAMTPVDIFTHAGITVCYYGPKEYYLSPKHFYDDVRDMEPLTLGAFTWNGYTCTSCGYPYTMLEARQDGCVFQVMILMENGEHKLAFSDADVQAVLGSLTQTGG